MLTLNYAGPPNGFTFPTGETAIDSNGRSWYCSSGGTPGTWVSGAAPVYSTPVFVTNTPQQLSTTQDMFLYIQESAAVSYTVNVGPTSTPANQVAQGAGTGSKWTVMVSVRAGEYVNVVCATMSSLIFTAVNQH